MTGVESSFDISVSSVTSTKVALGGRTGEMSGNGTLCLLAFFLGEGSSSSGTSSMTTESGSLEGLPFPNTETSIVELKRALRWLDGDGGETFLGFSKSGGGRDLFAPCCIARLDGLVTSS